MTIKHVQKKTQKPVIIEDYDGLLSGASSLIKEARRVSARTVNAIMTATYWEIGRRIVESEQEGKRRAGYGEELLKKSQKPSAELNVQATSERFPLPFKIIV